MKRTIINISDVQVGERISVSGNVHNPYLNGKWIVRTVSGNYISARRSNRPGHRGRGGWGMTFDYFEGAIIRLITHRGT